MKHRISTLILGTCLACMGCSEDKDPDPVLNLNASDGTGGAAGESTTGQAGAVGESTRDYTTVRISVDETVIQVGDTLILTAEATFRDAESGTEATEDVTDTVEWISSDADVAIFDGNSANELRALAPGELEISARLGILTSEALAVTVSPSVDLKITPSEFAGIVGESVVLQVIATDDGGNSTDVSNDIEWTASDDAIVTVSEGKAIIKGVGMATLTATYQGVTAEMSVDGLDCDYPTHNRTIGFRDVFPPLGWTEAYLPDGSTTSFSMAEFHCSPKYDDKNILIFVLGAGWCPACERFTTNILGPIAEELYGNGTLIVWHEAQDANYNSADSRYAFQHIGQLIDDGLGIRVGGVDALMLDNSGEYSPVPDFVMDQAIVTGFPSVWVIRRSDMTMIADQGRGRYYLPFTLIADDPNADWSDPPPPPFRSNCLDGEEEASEPNNQANMAARLSPGTYEGAICEREPDFYRVMVSGDWQVTLNFDASEGDLDMYVYDKDTGNPVLDENGRAVASNGTGDVETIAYSGRAIIVVYGYNAASANYSLTVEEL